ncbi:MAG: hypothetical protein KAU84_01255 [Thermoplasmatales archaeon]|nr:hypothetical protein [Thermoplasmatales archaeon]
MVKTEMTFDRLMKKPWYRSILNLTGGYEEGLQHMHYRYALQKDNKIPLHCRKKIEDFFGDSLQKLYDGHLVEKDCIKSSTGLSNFLQKLVDPPFKLLTRKEDEYGKYRYYTSQNISGGFFKTAAEKQMDLYPIYEINNIEFILGSPFTIDKPPHQTICTGYLFGLPTEIDFGSYYTPGETKIIKESILNIYANLVKINEVKQGKGRPLVSIFATAVTLPKKND